MYGTGRYFTPKSCKALQYTLAADHHSNCKHTMRSVGGPCVPTPVMLPGAALGCVGGFVGGWLRGRSSGVVVRGGGARARGTIS